MLTQALPYSSQITTYQRLSTSQQQQQQRPHLTNADSGFSRRFSLRSINSITSTTSTTTDSSTHPEESEAPSASTSATENKSKNLGGLIRSLRQRRRRSEVPKRGTEDDEIEMLSPAERPRERKKSAATAAEVKAKRSSVDSMFSWAAMTIYTYPGAGPVTGWF